MIAQHLAERNFGGLLDLADNYLGAREARAIHQQVFRELYADGEIDQAHEIRERYAIGEYAFLAAEIFNRRGAEEAVRWVEEQAEGRPRMDAIEGLGWGYDGDSRPLAALIEIVNLASDEELIRQIGGRIGSLMTNHKKSISDNLESVQQLADISETGRQAAKLGVLVRLAESRPESAARAVSLDDFGSVDKSLLVSIAWSYARKDLEGALKWAMSYPKEHKEKALAPVITELGDRAPERIPPLIAELEGRTRDYCIKVWAEHLQSHGNSEEAIAWEQQMTRPIEWPRWTLTVQ